MLFSLDDIGKKNDPKNVQKFVNLDKICENSCTFWTL